MSAVVPLGLIAAFFLTALLYASAGFGGGSTYAYRGLITACFRFWRWLAT